MRRTSAHQSAFTFSPSRPAPAPPSTTPKSFSTAFTTTYGTGSMSRQPLSRSDILYQRVMDDLPADHPFMNPYDPIDRPTRNTAPEGGPAVGKAWGEIPARASSTLTRGKSLRRSVSSESMDSFYSGCREDLERSYGYTLGHPTLPARSIQHRPSLGCSVLTTSCWSNSSSSEASWGMKAPQTPPPRYTSPRDFVYDDPTPRLAITTGHRRTPSLSHSTTTSPSITARVPGAARTPLQSPCNTPPSSPSQYTPFTPIPTELAILDRRSKTTLLSDLEFIAGKKLKFPVLSSWRRLSGTEEPNVEGDSGKMSLTAALKEKRISHPLRQAKLVKPKRMSEEDAFCAEMHAVRLGSGAGGEGTICRGRRVREGNWI